MNTELERAIKSLKAAGFTDEGGELWKPPVNTDAGRTIQNLLRANSHMLEALNAIAYPVQYLENQANEKGYEFNGHQAVMLSNDIEYLKGIAIEVLSALNQTGGNRK